MNTGRRLPGNRWHACPSRRDQAQYRIGAGGRARVPQPGAASGGRFIGEDGAPWPESKPQTRNERPGLRNRNRSDSGTCRRPRSFASRFECLPKGQRSRLVVSRPAKTADCEAESLYRLSESGRGSVSGSGCRPLDRDPWIRQEIRCEEHAAPGEHSNRGGKAGSLEPVFQRSPADSERSRNRCNGRHPRGISEDVVEERNDRVWPPGLDHQHQLDPPPACPAESEAGILRLSTWWGRGGIGRICAGA